MKNYIRHCLVLLLIILLVTINCNKKNPVVNGGLPYSNLPSGTWIFLGLENKYSLSLKIGEPYLYDCAGAEGLWRKNIRQFNSGWEYLGLRDTTLTPGRGVQDVLISSQNSNWLMVSFDPEIGTKHGIYRSLDDGRTWAISDSGLEFYQGGNRYYNRVQKFIERSDKSLAAGMGVYSTTNFGGNWQRVWDLGNGISLTIRSFVESFTSNQNLWIGGDTGLYPFLAKSIDSGINWQQIPYQQLTLQETFIFSVVIDPFDANHVFIPLGVAPIVQSTDNGSSWIPLDSTRYFMFADPKHQSHYYAYEPLIETWNSGITWKPVQTQLQLTAINDVIWDSKIEAFFLGTGSGVYLFKP